jgi:hypothetical protein
MFNKLKKTRLGKALYRFMHAPVIGWPLLVLVRFVQSEFFQISHLYPKNVMHNRRQAQTLERFVQGQK